MEYKTLLLILLATQTSNSMAELTGDNVCPTTVKEMVSLRVKVKEPVTIKSYTWCFRIPPRCSKYRVEMRDKFKIQHEPRTRTVSACCPGYAADKDNQLCVAVCGEGCVHGVCNQPETCTCEPGYSGHRCDTECEAGWFGADCGQRCLCDNEASCHHVTGACNCTAGWRGARCEAPCAEGSYGEGCLLECNCGENDKCHHVTGQCEEAPIILPEEVTSQAAAYRLGGDDVGETSTTILTPTIVSPETLESPTSASPGRGGDVEPDPDKLPPTTEEYPTTQRKPVIFDDPGAEGTTTVVATTQKLKPSYNNPNSSVYTKEPDTKLHSSVLASSIRQKTEYFKRLSEKLPSITERTEDDAIAQYDDNHLADGDTSYSHDKSLAGMDNSDASRQTEDPDARMSGDDGGVGLPPPPSNDLQHLRQVKTEEEAGASDQADGGLGVDLLSTSCVSAGVAVALILTATLIVAVAHWRKSGRKKASLGGSEPTAVEVFAYNGSIGDNVFTAHEIQTKDASDSLKNSHPGHSCTSESVSTLQREEEKRNCDFRDSMTSHYDIPPPARLSLQTGGRSSAGEPIYEEIPGWNARGTSSFLTFAGVLETSRV